MPETKFTKGPWEAEKLGNSEGITIVGGHWGICETMGAADFAPGEEQANAKARGEF